MAGASGLLVIERILRDRQGIWQQVVDDRDLGRLTGRMVVSSVIALACYGAVLGSFHSVAMALTSAVKLPLLFIVTLAICLPTLYLFNLVFGARLSVRQSLALVMVALTVTAMLALAFAPISLFFLITAPDYGFFKLLNVAILGLSALVGLRFLTGGMRVLNEHGLLAPAQPQHVAPVSPAVPAVPPAAAPTAVTAAAPPAAAAVPAAAPANGLTVAVPVTGPAAVSNGAPPVPSGAPAVPSGAPGVPNGVPDGAPAHAGTTVATPGPVARPNPALDHAFRQHAHRQPLPQTTPPSLTLLYVWILLFGFVGTQLAWTLRPFFGSPGMEFSLYRQIDGNFYAEIFRTIAGLF
ncbi:MAG TPA: hypothetical protein VFH03_06770 [Actinoplanes sp.]|nr:hypothetical protein [Actinoplanes sp.]